MANTVELYTARHLLFGTVELSRRRLTDYLNDASVDLVALEEGWLGDLTQPAAPPVRLAPANFHKHDLILATAADRSDTPSGLRPGYVRTTPVLIAAVAGPYFVVGQIHIPANIRFDILRLFSTDSRPFVPLTNARVNHALAVRLDALYSVVLVRSASVEFAGVLDATAAARMPALGIALQERMRMLSGSGGIAT